jgi:hypothetical protein
MVVVRRTRYTIAEADLSRVFDATLRGIFDHFRGGCLPNKRHGLRVRLHGEENLDKTDWVHPRQTLLRYSRIPQGC